MKDFEWFQSISTDFVESQCIPKDYEVFQRIRKLLRNLTGFIKIFMDFMRPQGISKDFKRLQSFRVFQTIRKDYEWFHTFQMFLKDFKSL